MKRKKIFLLGALGFQTTSLNGQTVRTRSVLSLLQEKLDSIDYIIDYFDTISIKQSKTQVITIVKKLFCCDQLIYLPAQNNLKYLFPIIYILSKIRKIPIIYISIGGWLADFITDKPIHKFMLRNVIILTQTQRLKTRLQTEHKILDTHYFPNFRFYEHIPRIEKSENITTLRLVFMSRINKLKGYNMIFNAISYFESKNFNISVDFYGQILEDDKEDFLSKIDKFKSANYIGILKPEEIYSVIGKYDILLLPTQYYTEGFPGAILDAYISGIPVIVTRWLHAEEFVDENVTGYIVPFNNGNFEFIDHIQNLYKDRDKLYELKRNAFIKSKSYSSNFAWLVLKPFLI